MLKELQSSLKVTFQLWVGSLFLVLHVCCTNLVLQMCMYVIYDNRSEGRNLHRVFRPGDCNIERDTDHQA